MTGARDENRAGRARGYRACAWTWTIATALAVGAASVLPRAVAAAEPASPRASPDASSPRPAAPMTRADATRIVAELRRIVTPEGVERSEAVRIGGIDQWVTIRGVDRRNPILLMIHGGPGWVSMPTSWWFQRGWEDWFTVVQWDQRGAGRTYSLNPRDGLEATLTPERMVADAEELVAWLRRQFGKERIFVLGHSWGSWLGLQVAVRHPEWLHAYVGVGQAADILESERRGYAHALEIARERGDTDAIRELEGLAPYARAGRPPTIEQLLVQRRWLARYGGVVAHRTGFDAESAAFRLSPDYTDADLVGVWDANELSVRTLLPYLLRADASGVKELRVPLFVFAGRHDYNVSSTVAAEWFERVRAPAKRFVWFEHSGHEVFVEEPGRMLVELVRNLRPIAESAGDVPPAERASSSEPAAP